VLCGNLHGFEKSFHGFYLYKVTIYTLSIDSRHTMWSKGFRKKWVKKATEERRRLGHETRQQILLLILKSEPWGMTTKELVNATGKDRRTIHKVCNECQKKGLVIPKTGRFGKYHVIEEATRIDDPSIGSLVVQLHMIRTGLLGLGEVALTSSMDFCDATRLQKILNNSRRKNSTIQQKESLGKFFLFEFALRLGSSLLYNMIKSMKYANPSLRISESKRNQLIKIQFETALNPTLLRGTFELLLLILEQRLWQQYTVPIPKSPSPSPPSEDEKMESTGDQLSKEETDRIRKKLMQERFGEMERIYKLTFPIVFEAMREIGYDMVYAPGMLTAETLEKKLKDPEQEKNS
jgi:hypothetical protein